MQTQSNDCSLVRRDVLLFGGPVSAIRINVSLPADSNLASLRTSITRGLLRTLRPVKLQQAGLDQKNPSVFSDGDTFRLLHVVTEWNARRLNMYSRTFQCRLTITK